MIFPILDLSLKEFGLGVDLGLTIILPFPVIIKILNTTIKKQKLNSCSHKFEGNFKYLGDN